MDKLLVAQETGEHHERRKNEVEQRLAALESEYEELLGMCYSNYLGGANYCTEKTIHDEETSNVDVADSMAEYKVYMTSLLLWPSSNAADRTNSKPNMPRSARPISGKCKILSNSLR